MSDSDPDFAAAIARIFDQWSGKVESIGAAAQKSGQIRTDISSEALANHIVATIEGRIMLSRLKKDERPLRQCLEILRITLELRA